MATATARVPQDFVRIIRSEFTEMPGMRLSALQFRRLWNLEPAECESLVQTLLRTGFLVVDDRGQYCRREDACP